MALGKRWSLTFKSLNNVECNVYIYDEGWTGAVTALIGADEPFFYQEDDDESLLTVLRYRTGYLRVVENSYNALLDDAGEISDLVGHVADVSFFFRTAPSLAATLLPPPSQPENQP